MEIKVIKEDKKGIEFEIIGEGHTFCNVLREALNKHKDVDFATYRIEHPLLSNPRMYVRTRVKVPKGAEEFIPLLTIKGVGPKTVKQLGKAKIMTAEDLVNSDIDVVAKRSGISIKVLEKIYKEAKDIVPPDKFGHKAIIKDALKDLSLTFSDLKAKFEEALANA